MFIHNFSNTKYFSFALKTLLNGLIFSKQLWIIDKWSYSTVKQTNEAQYAYGYICFILEKHMAQRAWSISWKYKASFKYNFKWLIINKIIIHENISCCYLNQNSSLFVVVYKGMHSRTILPYFTNDLSKQFLVFSRVNRCERLMEFQSRMYWANSLWLYVYGSEFLVRRKHEECQELTYLSRLSNGFR